MVAAKQTIKRAVLPSPGVRRLRFGLARGVRMRIDFENQTRTYLGMYETELNKSLRKILRPGVTSFDIGAQYGYDALLIAKHTRATVASFECDPNCVAQMTGNFALNPDLVHLIRPVMARVGDELSLDEWAFGEGFVPDFIKFDIEGGEVTALRSAHRLLAERHPALVIEVHSAELERDCAELLIGYGYRPIVVTQRRLAPDHRPGPHNRWLVAFTP